MLARASFSKREFDGTGANDADPRENLGGYQIWGTAFALEYSWASAWRVSGNVRLTDDRSGQPATSTLFASGYISGGQDPNTGYWRFFCGDIPRTRRYDLTPSIPDSDTRTLQTSARIEWRGESYSFDSLSAYYRSNSQVYQDFDGTSVGELMGVCTVEVNCDVEITPSLYAALGYTYDEPRFRSGSEDYGGGRFCGVSAGNTTSNFCVLGPSRVLSPDSAFLVPYVDGNVLQRAPQHQRTAALTFEPSHSQQALHWFVRASAAYQGRVFVRPSTAPTMANARSSMQHSDWRESLGPSSYGAAT